MLATNINAVAIIKRRAALFAIGLIVPIFSGVGLIFLLYFLKVFNEVQFLTSGMILVLVIFCFLFFLIKRLYIIKTSTYPAISSQELKGKMLEYFSQSANGKNIFEVSNAETTLTITWMGGISYNQLVSVGKQKIKMVVRVVFEENKKRIRIKTSQMNSSGTLGLLGGNLNFSYLSGFWITVKSTYVPSFSIENGKPVLKIEKLTANSLDIIGPVAQLALNGGWDVRAG